MLLARNHVEIRIFQVGVLYLIMVRSGKHAERPVTMCGAVFKKALTPRVFRKISRDRWVSICVSFFDSKADGSVKISVDVSGERIHLDDVAVCRGTFGGLFGDGLIEAHHTLRHPGALWVQLELS